LNNTVPTWQPVTLMTSFEAGETLRIPLFGFFCYTEVQTVASLSGSLTQSFTVLSLPPCHLLLGFQVNQREFYSASS